VYVALSAFAGRQIEFELEYAPAVAWTRSSAAAASGARPRFVWRITPVALMSGSNE